MELELKKLRKRANFKTQEAAALAIGVPKRRYESWERGEAMLSLEQACKICDVFECSLAELVGRSDSQYPDKRQADLNGYYESMNEERRTAITETARLMSEANE